MKVDTRALVVGAHVLVGGLFVGIAALGALDGAAPEAVLLRVLMGALVVGLGVALGRTM